jgi:DNA repair exonuclease SbcCD ATPase subunit
MSVKCDKCLQEIPHTHVEHLEKMKEQYQSELGDIVEDIEKFTSEKLEFLRKKTKVQEKVSEFQQQINDSKLDIQKLEGLKNSLEQYRESLDNLKLEELPKADFDDSIKKTEDRFSEETKTLEELQQKLADYEICKFILGEEGVKSFVVKKLLDLLNNTIEKYLIELGLNVRVKFDEYFEEVITADGKVFSYKNASGAEKKSLDFACAFSFSDMRRKINQVSSNVEFYDEALDNSLDFKGFQSIMKQIENRSEVNDTVVYIISHRKEISEFITGDTILLKKEKGITSRVL